MTNHVLTAFEHEEIALYTDAMLLANISAAETILEDPARFPKADLAIVEARWVEMCAVAAGRVLTALCGEG